MPFIHNIQKLKDRRKELRNTMTEAEIFLWSRIKNGQLLDCKFRRQHSVGGYILDFYCPKLKLAIELDGSQHSEGNNLEYDIIRTKYLESLGIKVIRYWNNEVLTNIEGVREDLMNKIKNV